MSILERKNCALIRNYRNAALSPSTKSDDMKNTNAVGLLFAALFALWHLAWIALVTTGLAQPMLDFVFWAHLIQPIYRVQPFSLGAAITLILISAALGYLFGCLGALVWKKLTSSAKATLQIRQVAEPRQPQNRPI